MGGNQRVTPPPATLYTSMGVCSPAVSGAMTIGKTFFHEIIVFDNILLSQ